MGWVIGGLVGIVFGRLNIFVVCLMGDGSFLMNGQEIMVVVVEKLLVIFIVLNDCFYGMVK